MLRVPFRILLIVGCLFFLPTTTWSQELTIGVPLVSESVNLARSETPLAQLVRSASAPGLIRLDQTRSLGFQLLLADSFTLSHDSSMVEFRVRSGEVFSNLQSINQRDLELSFARCASLRGVQKGELETKVFNKQQHIFVDLKSTWPKEELLRFVDQCPIFSARAIEVFDEDLGDANLMLGAGQYSLVARLSNREARLERVPRSRAWAAVITLRGFDSDEHALTALRSGSLDAFYSQNAEVAERAQKDSTLLQKPCGVYRIISRKGLEIECSPVPNLPNVKYAS
jgi:ABC-type oligopeptide transport system substrate-binding subunit